MASLHHNSMIPHVLLHLKTVGICKTHRNEKALKCKPSALIFGRGRAKELLHVRDDLRKRTR